MFNFLKKEDKTEKYTSLEELNGICDNYIDEVNKVLNVKSLTNEKEQSFWTKEIEKVKTDGDKILEEIAKSINFNQVECENYVNDEEIIYHCGQDEIDAEVDRYRNIIIKFERIGDIILKKMNQINKFTFNNEKTSENEEKELR